MQYQNSKKNQLIFFRVYGFHDEFFSKFWRQDRCKSWIEGIPPSIFYTHLNFCEVEVKNAENLAETLATQATVLEQQQTIVQKQYL